MNPQPGQGLHHLGATRSRRAHDHLLHTPDSFVWAPLPGMDRATACVHVSPHLGAHFAQYTIAFEAGGSWQSGTVNSRFVYVLTGSVSATGSVATTLHVEGFCSVPPGEALTLTASGPARVIVLEKPYIALAGDAPPESFYGNERHAAGTTLLGDEAVQVRALVPPDTRYDFAVNTMTYQPGAHLSMVEVHVMEHGLLMLEGGGIYRLGDAWYPVAAGDFVWVAPCCPQWFGALGPTPSRYLIYKDWNRAPLAGR